MNTCYWTLVKTMECTKTRVDLVVNYGILVIMMYQYRFISYDKVATLVGNILILIIRETGHIWWQGFHCNFAVPEQFCGELKTA